MFFVSATTPSYQLVDGLSGVKNPSPHLDDGKAMPFVIKGA
jgi:hypothetical protein